MTRPSKERLAEIRTIIESRRSPAPDPFHRTIDEWLLAEVEALTAERDEARAIVRHWLPSANASQAAEGREIEMIEKWGGRDDEECPPGGARK